MDNSRGTTQFANPKSVWLLQSALLRMIRLGKNLLL